MKSRIKRRNQYWASYLVVALIVALNMNLVVSAAESQETTQTKETTDTQETKTNHTTYHIYFGQLHSHTAYSDGVGTVREAFEYAAKEAKQIDFLAVTDHSNAFDGMESATLSSGEGSEEWKEGHKAADEVTNETFVGIYGYEMTWDNSLGHLNTFNTKGFESFTKPPYQTRETALENYYRVLETESASISQFNHPSPNFGDFDDFGHYSKKIDSLITLIEVGNGEDPIGGAEYHPSYEYYTRALDKGWHVAPTNNQDNHAGKWGDSNTCRTVVLAPTLSRETIYDALRNRRVYATEDNDLEIMYQLNGNIMGSILNEKGVGQIAAITIDLKDKTDPSIGTVEVIVDGGTVIASKTVSTKSETVSFFLPMDYSYYYIRVTQPDGNIAVTAPVWIEF